MWLESVSHFDKKQRVLGSDLDELLDGASAVRVRADFELPSFELSYYSTLRVPHNAQASVSSCAQISSDRGSSQTRLCRARL